MTANTPDDRSRTERHGTDPFTSWAVGTPFFLLGPVQTVTVERTRTSVVELVLLVVLLCVGCLLTYHAVRGYRRNDDRSMALFAIGLCLLTVLHALLKLGSELVIPALLGGGPDVVATVAATSQIVDIVGLVAVFYAMLR